MNSSTTGENGFLVKPRDDIELSQAITTILTDSELLSRMAQNSRKKAEQYTVEKMVEHYHEHTTTLHSCMSKEMQIQQIAARQNEW